MLKLSENPAMLCPPVSSLRNFAGRWQLVHTKPRTEKALAHDLADEGIAYFLPMVRRTIFSGGRKRRSMIPLFPSYLFVCGGDESKLAVLRTNRVCNVIDIPNQSLVIEELSAIERVLKANIDLNPCALPKADQNVQITRGPFQGIVGKVVRHMGVTQLILAVSILGRGVEMNIETDLVEVIDQGKSQWQMR